MIIISTPLRISFFGGGADYPQYFLREGGATLVTSINRRLTISIHRLMRFFDYSMKIHYSRVEMVNSLDEIKLPVVRETMRFMGVTGDVEIHMASDLPARTGLGSSSAATVAMLTALHAYLDQTPASEQIAAEAVHVEQRMMCERGGCQDQYACAIGGLLHLQFLTCGGVRAIPVAIPGTRAAELQKRLMLFYTGTQRTAHEVLAEQMEKTARGLNDKHLRHMQDQVKEAIGILQNGRQLREFGELLHDGWQRKRCLSSRVSTPALDEIYDRALRAGAVGGKLLGAGAGGFFLLYVDPENQDAVRAALSDLRQVNFRFDTEGTRVIFRRPFED